jgi:ubiquinone/menaquinone biosynthesis C-methylase UbiE
LWSVRGISFDRAAGYYDATRGLPDRVRDALAEILAAELAGRERCLEIGVGTGRIALPLHERGVCLAGADIAPAMLQRLIANAGGEPPFPLLLADATAAPFADVSFDAVLASHVLHLIPDWKTAVDEAMRILRPHGVLLTDFGGGMPPPWSAASADVLRRHGILRGQAGAGGPDDVAGHLAQRATVRPLPPAALTMRRSLGQDLDEWERQIHSWTWPYSPRRLREACDDVRAWAAARRWPLDREVKLERVIQWWAFEQDGWRAPTETEKSETEKRWPLT